MLNYKCGSDNVTQQIWDENYGQEKAFSTSKVIESQNFASYKVSKKLMPIKIYNLEHNAKSNGGRRGT